MNLQKAIESAECENDLEDFTTMAENMTMSGEMCSPQPGGPFSALTPSMWPQDILASLQQPEVFNLLLHF